MLPGFGGHLISEAFLEASLLAIGDDGRDAAGRFRGEFITWRQSCCGLGPASSARTLLHVGAAPLLLALGFEAPAQIELIGPHVAATVPHGGHRAALLVTT